MNRRRAHLIAIPLALIPLALIIAANELLYQTAGIGRPRGVFGFLGLGERALPADGPVLVRGPRWSGSQEEPLDLYFIGSSISVAALRPEGSRAITERLGLRLHTLCRPAQPFDRFYDLLRLADERASIDLVLVEFSPLITNDEQLVFRSDIFGDKARWSGVVLNKELRALRRAIEAEERGREEVGDDAVELDQLSRQEAARFDELLPAEFGPPKEQEARPYHPSRLDWLRLGGVEDLARSDRIWVRTQQLAMKTLSLIRDRCRRRGVGLILYAPPRAPDLRLEALDPPPLQAAMARHALAAIRVWTRANEVPFLDYDAWSDRESEFRDSIHLNFEGSRRFSQQLFEDLGAVLEKKRAAASAPR